MRFFAFAVFEFFLVLVLGLGLTSVEVHAELAQLDGEATKTAAESHADSMLRRVIWMIGWVTYGCAGVGFVIGLAVWYRIKGRERFEGRPLIHCMLKLTIPVVIFMIVCLIRPLTDLANSIGGIMGKATPVGLVIFVGIAAVFFHFVSVLPFKPPPAEES